MATLKLDIVTPERKAYSEDVDSVVIPAAEGEMEALPNHVPLLTLIKPGELQVKRQGNLEVLAVGEGFVEVTMDTVTVLTDMALNDEQIDESKVEEALKRAEDALSNTEHGSEEAVALMATIQKSIAQLGVKRRKRR